MTDRLTLSRLAVFAHHGTYPEEERLGQRFFISVTCQLDLAPAGLTDDHERSVNYEQIAVLVNELATKRRFQTIEGLAEAIAGALLSTFSSVQTVTVRVEKPEAPLPFIFASVAVEIERTRSNG